MQLSNISENMKIPDLNPLVGTIIRIIILLIFGFIASKTVEQIIVKMFNLRDGEPIETESQQIKLTVLKHTIGVVQGIIWIIVLLSIAGILQMTQFVQVIAALSVIVGYVARDFIMDFIMGLLVLFEQQFRVGDIVTFPAINQLKGKVLEIGVRTTTVQLVDTNDLYIVSNRLITAVIVHKRQLAKASAKGVKAKNAKKR